MAISVCGYDIKWETIVTVMLLSNSKAHKFFAKSVEVVLMVIEFKKVKTWLEIFLQLLHIEHMLESESIHCPLWRLEPKQPKE